MVPKSDGDGWTVCGRGHRHWGRFGAAGLLLRERSSAHTQSDNTHGNNTHGDNPVSGYDRFVLQHRSPWTHGGDTWGLPGGARDSHEDAIDAATREAAEEAGIDSSQLRPTGLLVDDHGGWTYTTVIATPLTYVRPYAANAESVEIRWCTLAEIAQLPLHHGFAQTWPVLRDAPSDTTLLVDLASQHASRADVERIAYALGRHGARWAGADPESVLHATLPQITLLDEPATKLPARVDELIDEITNRGDRAFVISSNHTLTTRKSVPRLDVQLSDLQF